jgi:hypothetical protein
MLAERRLLEPISHDLQKGAGERLWQSLASLDAYRRKFEDMPDSMTNAILLGSLLVPLGLAGQPARLSDSGKEERLSIGMLPVARRDVERFRQIAGLQRRLLDASLSSRAKRALMHRGPFREALTWLEIHGQAPEALEHWRGFVEASGTYEADIQPAEGPPRRRRRRRRRRSFRPAT